MKLNPHGYTQADGYRLFKMPPEAAIKYFGGKEIIKNWQSIMGDAHSRAFAVAGETREEVLQDLYSALEDSLKNGSTMDSFRNDAMQRLQKSGWLRGVVKYEDNEPVYESTAVTTYDRLERIYRTNLASAHAAGRFESIMSSELEFVEYVTAEDDRVREEHRLAAGVYHKDDPFLLYFSPPNGYNCRCSLQARSEAWVDRHGYEAWRVRMNVKLNRVKTRDIIEEDGSVRTYHVYQFSKDKVFEADKGWDYNPALKFWEARSVRPELIGDSGIADIQSETAKIENVIESINEISESINEISDYNFKEVDESLYYGLWDRLDETEREALKESLSHSLGQIRAGFNRGEELSDDLIKYSESIQKVLERETVKEDSIVYRISSRQGLPQLEKGTIFYDPAFVSTTTDVDKINDEDGLYGLVSDVNPYIMEIHIPKGTTGAYLEYDEIFTEVDWSEEYEKEYGEEPDDFEEALVWREERDEWVAANEENEGPAFVDQKELLLGAGLSFEVEEIEELEYSDQYPDEHIRVVLRVVKDDGLYWKKQK